MFVSFDAFTKTLNLLRAVVAGEVVSEERMKARLVVCSTCPHVGELNGQMRCGICGCRLKGDKSLLNLARFEETGSYGCKFSGGSRWKKIGV